MMLFQAKAKFARLFKDFVFATLKEALFANKKSWYSFILPKNDLQIDSCSSLLFS